MSPSWFTKLRDIKTEFKQSKQQDKPHGLPRTTSKKQQDAPVRLAKSFSLHRASTKARVRRFESEISDACRSEDNVRPSVSSNESDLYKSRSNVWDSQSYTLHKEATSALDSCQSEGTSQMEVDVRNAYLQNNNVEFIAKFKGNGVTKSISNEENQVFTQKGHVVSDTDTEEFALMSDSSSTFESETSSAGSSVSSKCSIGEEGNEGDETGQQRLTSSQSMHTTSRKNCDGLLVTNITKAKAQKESGSCAELNFRLSQVTPEIQQRPILYELQRRRQCTVFSSLIGINGRGDGRKVPSDADKGSPGNRRRCISTGTSSSLREGNGNTSRQKLEGNETCASLDDCTCGRQMADRRMPYVFTLRREMSSKAKFGDTTQMQRRRQRGSSISAVLPPNLQGVVGDSVAFVQISNDPYEDFKQSMYEMIMEKDLEGTMDVEELLYCYLTLNSPEHHELIKEVFCDVWSAVLMRMR